MYLVTASMFMFFFLYTSTISCSFAFLDEIYCINVYCHWI